MDELAIRRYARRLRMGVIAAFVLTMLLILYARLGWHFAGGNVLVHTRKGQGIGPFQLSDGILILLAIAIFELTEALRAVVTGDMFSTAVVRRFRLFALWLLIMALFSSLAPVLGRLLTIGSPGGHHVPIVLDLRDLLLILVTLLLFLLSRLLERARAIEDEMREIV